MFVDVTDTVRAHWRAGIQRVVLQLVSHLGGTEGVVVEPVVWLGSARGFRRLTPGELASLEPGAPGGPAPADPSSVPVARTWVRTVRRWLRPVRRVAREGFDRSGLRTWVRHTRDAVLLRTRDRSLRPLLVAPGPGAVLLECDSSWNVVEVDRDELLAGLRLAGVRIVSLVYDLLPLEHPEWFDDQLVEVFTSTMDARLRHADRLLAISHDSAEAARRRAADLGVAVRPPEVVPLGADLTGPGPSTAGPAAEPSLPDALREDTVVLTVGTVEPRKNHATLLAAMERRWADGSPTVLVIVGRPGWNNDELLARLRSHPELGRRLWWFDDADDDLLAALYATAAVVAVPAITEGFGLPVIEGLAAGVPVVSSNGGALPEAGGELVDLVDPLDVGAWCTALAGVLDDPAIRSRRLEGLAGYRPPTWAGSAEQVARVLRSTGALVAEDDG